MAKQLVGPIERHLDKGVVAIAALLFFGAVAKFMVLSPTVVDLGHETVTPKQIDDKVRARAVEVLNRIDRTPIPPPAEDGGELPTVEAFAAATTMAGVDMATPLPSVVSIGPEVPIIEAAHEPEGWITLAETIKLDKPACTSGRTTFRMGTGDAEPPMAPENSYDTFDKSVNWVTISVAFDRKAQVENQRHYGRGGSEVVFTGFQVERRARRLDGTWANEDWATIEPLTVDPPPLPPTVTLVQKDGKLSISEEQDRQIRLYFDELQREKTQLDLLRPLPPEIRNGDPWRFPILTTLRDVLSMDDEYLYPDDQPAQDPENRYALLLEEPEEEKEQAAPDKPIPPGAAIKKRFGEIEKEMKEAKQQKNAEALEDIIQELTRLALNPMTGRLEVEKARRLKEQANQDRLDIIRYGYRQGATGRGSGRTAGKSGKRLLMTTQQAWVIDGLPDSVLGGNTYQYRMRGLVYNPYAGETKLLKNAGDATRVVVAGAWSPPSDPVTVEPSTRFFVLSHNKGRQQVGVDVYQWEDGVWVKTRANKGIGERVMVEKKRTKVPLPDGETDNAEITFDASVRILDIDHDRAVRTRKRQGRKGVVFQDPKPSCVVTLIDDQGRLMRRVIGTDKTHPGKKLLDDRVWRPAPKAKEPLRPRPIKGKGMFGQGKPPKRPKGKGP